MSTLGRNEIAQRCFEAYQSIILLCCRCLCRAECTGFRNPFHFGWGFQVDFKGCWIFLQLETQAPQIVHSPLAEPVSELGKGDTARSLQGGRGGTKGELKDPAVGLRLYKSPNSGEP